MRDPKMVTNFYPRDRVVRLSEAQGDIKDPKLMLEATRIVLATKRDI
jgi:hypothetical protein